MRAYSRRFLLLAILLLISAPAAAQSSITLAWDANTEPDVAGYVLSWGTRAGAFTASVNAGNATQWTVSGLEPDQRYYFTVQAYNTEGLHSAPAAAISNDGLITGSTGGFLADDRPSIFWQHRQTGRLLTWHMTGANVIDTRALSVPAVSDTAWEVVTTADFNRDGFTDMLWRHRTAGWLAVWFLQNNTVLSTRYLSVDRVTDPNWKVRGAGDVDGDGYADVVWQHATGKLAVWLMRGEMVQSTLVLGVATSGAWEIAAVTDVNGDRCADLIWQNAADGRLAAWLLRGATVTLTQLLSVSRVSDPDWRIQGAGAVDSTGRVALLWRHVTQGSVALWYLEGTTVTGTAMTNPSRVADLEWKMVGGR